MEIKKQDIYVTTHDKTFFKISCEQDSDGVSMSAYAKKIKQVYVLTEDELKELISESFDEGAVWEWDKHFGKVPMTKSKANFIKSITKEQL